MGPGFGFGEDDLDETTLCLPQSAADLLATHLSRVDGVMGLVAGYPTDQQVVSFLEVPGFPGPIEYATLAEACAEPSSFEAFCDPISGLCSRIECTGFGAGWVAHLYSEEVLVRGDMMFDHVSSSVSWDDAAAGLGWTARSTVSSADGTDWSVIGAGALDIGPDGWTWQLEETFPDLLPAFETVLAVTHGPTGGVGTVTANGTVLAEVDGTLGVNPTTTCP
jgi:hypothetical protein